MEKSSFSSTIRPMDLYEWQEIEGRLALYFPQEKQSISLNWASDLAYHLRQQYVLRKEPIAKALGIKGDRSSIVWDLTCGTGKDSLLLLAFGARVCAFERNGPIFRLLSDAHKHLDPTLRELFILNEGDARYLDLSILPKPDALYLDPMYQEAEGKARKALPRKEMRLFRLLAGDDQDAKELLSWALAFAKEQGIGRVVVKHPLKAPPLLAGVVHSYEGKSTSYDLYRVL